METITSILSLAVKHQSGCEASIKRGLVGTLLVAVWAHSLILSKFEASTSLGIHFKQLIPSENITLCWPVPLPISKTEHFSGNISLSTLNIGEAFRNADGAVWHKNFSGGGDFFCILVHLSLVVIMLGPQ